MDEARILIVNDVPAIAGRIREQVAAWGVGTVEIAEGGEAALARLEAEPFDLVISDVYMPVIDGWQLCRLLRGSGRTASPVPVLLVSATYRDQTAEQLAWEAGAFGFLQIPYDEDELRTLVVSQLAPAPTPRAAPLVGAGRGRVLVADDSPTFREGVAEALREAGYEVVTAADGVEAIQVVESKRPEVLFVDYQMPKVNGIQLLHWATSHHPECLTLLMTAHGSEDLAVQLLRAGAEDYLKKPVPYSEFPAAAGRAFAKLNIRRINDQFQEKTEALRGSEERYRGLFERSPDPIVLADPDRVEVLEVNRAYEELSGFDRSEVVGQRLHEIVAPSQRPDPGEPADAIARHLLAVDETLLRRLDGEPVTVSVHASLVEFGRTRLLQLFFRDLTRERMLRDKLVQAEKLSSVGQLASGVAHEINNPLTGIIGFSQLLMERRGGLPEAMQRDVETIFRQALRTQEIVANLLKFARAERVSQSSTDLNEQLEECLSLKRYSLRTHNVTLERELALELPLVTADAHRLQQVFLNVIDNAFDAMTGAHGGGTLTVRTRREGEDWVAVEIEDDGPGLREPAKVFDPFYTTKEPGKGTGLGLSISYGLVRDHGGELLAENRPEGGARFTILLPVHRPEERRIRRTVDRRPEDEVRSGPRGQGERILVVDDEEGVLDIATRILDDAGYVVEVAHDGDRALARLGDGSAPPVDLVLTDLRMPGATDGADLFRWLRDRDPALAQRVVFMTGDTVGEGTQLLLGTLANPCLGKPFGVEGLRTAVREVLDGAPDRGDAPPAGDEPGSR